MAGFTMKLGCDADNDNPAKFACFYCITGGNFFTLLEELLFIIGLTLSNLSFSSMTVFSG